LITNAACLKALDLHSATLLQQPNVQGVGIGRAPSDVTDSECVVMVYLAEDVPTDVPDYLEVPCEGGEIKRIPVRVTVQGPLRPE
jgi:hypothetical protein